MSDTTNEPDTSKWEVAPVVTDRPADVFEQNSTLASRKADAKKRGSKRVAEGENKAVASGETTTKGRAKR